MGDDKRNRDKTAGDVYALAESAKHGVFANGGAQPLRRRGFHGRDCVHGVCQQQPEAVQQFLMEKLPMRTSSLPGKQAPSAFGKLRRQICSALSSGEVRCMVSGCLLFCVVQMKERQYSGNQLLLLARRNINLGHVCSPGAFPWRTEPKTHLPFERS